MKLQGISDQGIDRIAKVIKGQQDKKIIINSILDEFWNIIGPQFYQELLQQFPEMDDTEQDIMEFLKGWPNNNLRIQLLQGARIPEDVDVGYVVANALEDEVSEDYGGDDFLDVIATIINTTFSNEIDELNKRTKEIYK